MFVGCRRETDKLLIWNIIFWQKYHNLINANQKHKMGPILWSFELYEWLTSCPNEFIKELCFVVFWPSAWPYLTAEYRWNSPEPGRRPEIFYDPDKDCYDQTNTEKGDKQCNAMFSFCLLGTSLLLLVSLLSKIKVFDFSGGPNLFLQKFPNNGLVSLKNMYIVFSTSLEGGDLNQQWVTAFCARNLNREWPVQELRPDATTRQRLTFVISSSWPESINKIMQMGSLVFKIIPILFCLIKEKIAVDK